MRQQYGAGASFWNTDEGKDLLLDTMSNQYTGDQAGLPGFYQDQAKAGLGQMEMIKKGLGYERAAQWLSGPMRIRPWLFGGTTGGSQRPTQALVHLTRRSRQLWKRDSFLLLGSLTRLADEHGHKNNTVQRRQLSLLISSGN